MKIKTYLKYLQTFAKNCFSGKLELFLQSPALNSHSGHFKNQKSWIMSTSHGFLTASFSDIFEFSVSKSKKSFQIMLMCDKKMICNWRNKGFCLYVYFSNIAIVCSKATITIVSLIFWPRAVFCASSRSWTFQFLFFTWFFFQYHGTLTGFFSFVLYCSYVQYTFNLKLKTDKLQLSNFFSWFFSHLFFRHLG